MGKLAKLKAVLFAFILMMTISEIVNADHLTVAGKTYVGIDLGNTSATPWVFVFGDVGDTNEFSIFAPGTFFDGLVYSPGAWQEVQSDTTVPIFLGDIEGAKPDLEVSFLLMSVFLTDLGLITPPSTAMFGNLKISMIFYLDIGAIKVPIFINVPKPFLMIEIASP